MTVAVVRFGGSNCDRDARLALEHLGIDAEIVWHAEGLPDDVSGVVLPGGFSYGDYLRAGAMAAHSPILDAIRERRIPVLGVCNGAQVGTEAGLVPGAFTVNESARFQCEHVHLRVENADTPWTSEYDEGEVIELPIAHGEGRYEVGESTLARLDLEARVLFRYCDADGEVTRDANPNGSAANVAGLLGDDGRVAVLMPHPERATLPDLGGTDGAPILRGLERASA